MALPEQDREWIQLIAKELAFEVCKQVLIEHTQNCPHGIKIMKAKTMVIGIVIGLSLTAVLSGGSAALVLKMMGGL
jgi:hypothetical protein